MPFITSPLASRSTLPSSRVSVAAISSARRRAMSAARQRTRPRSGPGVFFQPVHAAFAASMARCTSAAVASGNSAITSDVSAGLMLRAVSRESGWYQVPLT
jgi:hypothetical protein